MILAIHSRNGENSQIGLPSFPRPAISIKPGPQNNRANPIKATMMAAIRRSGRSIRIISVSFRGSRAHFMPTSRSNGSSSTTAPVCADCFTASIRQNVSTPSSRFGEQGAPSINAPAKSSA